MYVRCAECQKVYDDESRWTICPHNSLRVAHDAPYCRYHDLYNCNLEHPTTTRTSDQNQQTASIQSQKKQS
jgi:hypothetical protein